jgi:hypothetical protein
MTIEEIKAELAELRRLRFDRATSDRLERRLWRAVLKDIADGGPAATLKARLALQSSTVTGSIPVIVMKVTA